MPSGAAGLSPGRARALWHPLVPPPGQTRPVPWRGQMQLEDSNAHPRDSDGHRSHGQPHFRLPVPASTAQPQSPATARLEGCPRKGDCQHPAVTPCWHHRPGTSPPPNQPRLAPSPWQNISASTLGRTGAKEGWWGGRRGGEICADLEKRACRRPGPYVRGVGCCPPIPLSSPQSCQGGKRSPKRQVSRREDAPLALSSRLCWCPQAPLASGTVPLC